MRAYVHISLWLCSSGKLVVFDATVSGDEVYLSVDDSDGFDILGGVEVEIEFDLNACGNDGSRVSDAVYLNCSNCPILRLAFVFAIKVFCCKVLRLEVNECGCHVKEFGGGKVFPSLDLVATIVF